MPATVLRRRRGGGGYSVGDANQRLLAPRGPVVSLILARLVLNGYLSTSFRLGGLGSVRRREPRTRARVGSSDDPQKTGAQEAGRQDDEPPRPHHGFGAPGRRDQAVGQSQDGGHGKNQEGRDAADSGPHGGPDEPANCAAASRLTLVGYDGGEVGHCR